jgi:hypothetical protein
MRPIRTYVRWRRRAGVDPLLAESVEELGIAPPALTG